MTCQICGRECAKRGRNQKYCPECAEKAQKEKMRTWRMAHKPPTPAGGRCKKCGDIVGGRRRLCDKCKAENYRAYQREYFKRTYIHTRCKKIMP